MPAIRTNLEVLRRQRGVSAIALAASVDVSRQTIYAIESGAYVPNTAVALRLARALDTTVENLFSLAGDACEPDVREEPATLLPGSAPIQTGQAVELCQVNKKLMATGHSPMAWYFPAADGVLAGKPGRVRIFQAEANFRDRILVAGCDPGISVLARHAHAAGIELVLAHRNSSQALALLKEGCVHVAGTHLKDEATGESNLPEIRRVFAKNAVAAISFAVWEEGIVTAKGNPKGIRGIEDFARKDITIVNREKGAGSRVLLESGLKRLGIGPQKVQGYDKLAPGHLPAAWQVQSGIVDCCLATGAAARLFGLHFIPLVSERYDLVVRRQYLELPRIQNLLDTLNRSGFRRELEGLGGYDTRVAGQRVL